MELLENIPHELRLYPQWVNWKYAPPKGSSGKRAKPLYNSRTTLPARTNDPASWSTWVEALDTYRKGLFDGVGFVLTGDDPFVILDLDDCVRDEKLTPQAWPIVEHLDSYTELSVSGTGIHIIVSGTVPKPVRRKPGLEVYSASQYIALTGRVFDGRNQIRKREARLRALWESHFPNKNVPPGVVGTRPATPRRDGQVILDKARSAKNGEKFRRLFDKGNVPPYSSESERDLALVQLLLYWTDGDDVLTDSLFRASACFRPKWDGSAGAGTYGQRTIAEALELYRAERSRRAGGRRG